MIGGDGALATTEVYGGRALPRPARAAPRPRRATPRRVLQDGRVLVAGGYDADGRAIAATELLAEQGSDPG